MDADFNHLYSLLSRIHQQHLLAYWQDLTSKEKNELSAQIHAIDAPLFLRQKSLALSPKRNTSACFEPSSAFDCAGDPERKQAGQKLLETGKVGCIILAGGQGTRLGFDGPKGMFPISLVKKKTLFQLFAEKVNAASAQAGTSLPLAIMTSPQNDLQIRHYFKENHYFGLQDSQISFFTQGNLPFLNAEGNLFLERPGKIAFGPNGNGFCLKYFFDSGIWDRWNLQGVECVNLILIDNALADPFDQELAAYHCQTQAELTLKCVERNDPQEKVGVIVKNRRHQIRVCEYTDIPQEERIARLPNGTLKHRLANLSLFCFSMPFIAKAAQIAETALVLHPSWKAAPYIDDQGNFISKGEPNAWKFEAFIFDILAFAHHIEILQYPRRHCFAPLKNAHGTDSPETVRAALLQRDLEVFAEITGTIPPKRNFELSADFYYPTPDLLAKWSGKPLPALDYIDG